MVEFLQNYWFIVLCAIVGISYIVYVFVSEPKKIKEWLVYACLQAENELGAGAGELKLRKVYDLFVSKFPVFSKFVSFERFKNWIKIALDNCENYINNIGETNE